MVRFEVYNRVLGTFISTVDDQDVDLTFHKWKRGNSQRPHLVRNIKVDGKRIHLTLHRIVMERKLGRPLLSTELVDHADCDPLNNTRANLRLCTQSQNTANTRLTSRNTSGYKGIALHKSGKWQAQLSFHKRTIYLGLYATPQEAHEVYRKAAIEYHGEFARPE